MDQNDFTTIILAAGKGKRMNSALPKVLHPVAGTPLIKKVINSVKKAGSKEVRIVVGFGEKLVRSVVEPSGAICFQQSKQWGTADAVKSADPDSLNGLVLILNGDHPLITDEDIKIIISSYRKKKQDLCVVSTHLKNPGSYGRIIRHHDKLAAIVEAKDASSETLKIKEINSGIYITKAEVLKKTLPLIKNLNAQQEFYLTDIISACQTLGLSVDALPTHPRVAYGVNTQFELSKATKYLFLKKAKELMNAGVVIIDPQNTYIEEDVTVGLSSVIYPGSYLRGKTEIGPFCVIEPQCYIAHSLIGESVQIKAGSYLEGARINSKSTIGPFAHLRAGTKIGSDVKIGNFVETKNAVIGDRVKASHLSYLGDVEIGSDTNIGCGTITCNYQVDKNKYQTKIGQKVFVGSDTQFVAPVEIGDHAIIGSGSTITKSVPAEALAVARGRQIIKENYAKKFKKD